uniref:t-SNARE coiled-coil homology domain-containing protein n=1 Tax=Mesocestoides corti TaxID=53468 RepID=A0A5K3G0A8_MESCO
MFETEAGAIEDRMEKLRQSRDRLRTVLARQVPVADEKARIIERLEQLHNKSEAAVQTAKDAVDTARQQLDDLKNFDAYVARTKQELEAMSVIRAEISDDLDRVHSQVQGIHLQVDDAFNTAKLLQTTVSNFAQQIKALKDDV